MRMIQSLLFGGKNSIKGLSNWVNLKQQPFVPPEYNNGSHFGEEQPFGGILSKS